MARLPTAATDPAETAILILGTQRSGTTWLAKIFDSHPDVLYRHEPDEIHPPPPDPAPAAVRPLLHTWLADRCLRTASKRPFFRKSWQSRPAGWLRVGLAYALNGAVRLGGPLAAAGRLPLPDLGAARHARLVVKSVRLCASIGTFARALPDARIILIVRHPCGQVDSVMRGTRQRRFELREAGTDMPFEETAAIARAGLAGVSERGFQALPDAAKYAWAWVAFNEAAAHGIAGLPNARLLVYEALCADPLAESQALFAFAGLAWHRQTAAFLARSSTAGGTDYYAVFRTSLAAAERWKTAMTPADQQAVRSVVRHSALARLWSDTAAATE
jgi:hypothetical protein